MNREGAKDAKMTLRDFEEFSFAFLATGQWQREFRFAVEWSQQFRDFEPISGEWRLEIDGQEGSRKYENCWMAR